MGSFVEESKKKMVIGRVDFSRDENSRCAPAELQVRGGRGGGSAAAVFGILLHRVRPSVSVHANNCSSAAQF